MTGSWLFKFPLHKLTPFFFSSWWAACPRPVLSCFARGECEQGLTVPGIVVKMVLRMIRGTVAKTADFNVRDLCPIKHADRTFIPALFVAGKADDFIQPHHRYVCMHACMYVQPTSLAYTYTYGVS